MDKIFNKNGFSVERHPPYVLEKIVNIYDFESDLDPKFLHQDMPIKFPHSDYKIPGEL